MYWECSECGGQLKRRRPPSVCPSCGLAGVMFIPADADETGRVPAGSLREAWVRAGFEAANAMKRPTLTAPESRFS